MVLCVKVALARFRKNSVVGKWGYLSMPFLNVISTEGQGLSDKLCLYPSGDAIRSAIHNGYRLGVRP
jgi:hypothetical protein